eukprot:3848201-Amphidinium_carterae.2
MPEDTLAESTNTSCEEDEENGPNLSNSQPTSTPHPSSVHPSHLRLTSAREDIDSVPSTTAVATYSQPRQHQAEAQAANRIRGAYEIL